MAARKTTNDTAKVDDPKVDDPEVEVAPEEKNAKFDDPKVDDSKVESAPAKNTAKVKTESKSEKDKKGDSEDRSPDSPYIHTNDGGGQIVASVRDGEYVEKVDNKSKRPLRRIHETFDTTGVAGNRVD